MCEQSGIARVQSSIRLYQLRRLVFLRLQRGLFGRWTNMSRLDAWHEPRQEKKFWSQVLVLFFFKQLCVFFFIIFVCFSEQNVVFEMVCQGRGGLVETCDQNGKFRCKCAWGYVYESDTNTCQPVK